MSDTITMPKLGFDMQEGTLVRWVRTEGEAINKGDVLAEIETDKATVEVESSASGIVRRLLVDQGAVVPIGAPIAIVGNKDEPIEVPSTAMRPGPQVPGSERPAEKPVPAPGVQAPVGADHAAPKVSPLARRIARERNLDLERMHGTGPGGRIVRRDIEAALAGGSAATVPGSAAILPPARVIEPRVAGDESVQLSKLRQAIARRMAESKSTIPHFYVTHEYNVESLVALREQALAVLPETEKVSVNDFVVKAVGLCLREFPNLNASYVSTAIVRHGAINIGVAVAVEGGLMTVVCRGADQKPLRQIASELKAMAARARAGKVHPTDIEGSTFTVSNLGMYDAESFAAIINPPEAAILAVGSARQVPVVEAGAVKPGWRMKATIAVDHRVSDGAEAARFMQSLAKYLELPLRLFLD